jgi:hypothetical protein
MIVSIPKNPLLGVLQLQAVISVQSREGAGEAIEAVGNEIGIQSYLTEDDVKEYLEQVIREVKKEIM